VPIREVRCSNLDCGTLNRVPAYSIRKIPKCGRCGEPLPEKVAVKTLRGLYQSRRFFLGLAILASPLLFFAWIGSVPRVTTPRPILTPTVSRVDSCAGSAQPGEGIYRWYGPMWGADIAELTIATATRLELFHQARRHEWAPSAGIFHARGIDTILSSPIGYVRHSFHGSHWPPAPV
jgi:hypothetical protein